MKGINHKKEKNEEGKEGKTGNDENVRKGESEIKVMKKKCKKVFLKNERWMNEWRKWKWWEHKIAVEVKQKEKGTEKEENGENQKEESII